MTKVKFLMLMHEKLAGLPRDEVEERLTFYCEMIDDRIEEGLTEEEAVAAVGSVEEISAQITSELSPEKKPEKKEQESDKQKLKAWGIALLVVGSPVWFSLLVAAFAVVVSLYASVWAVIASLWAVFASLVCSAVGVFAGSVGFILAGHTLSGIAMIGAGFICAGLSIFLFYGCKAAAMGTVVLTKKIVLWVKRSFVKKEGAL